MVDQIKKIVVQENIFWIFFQLYLSVTLLEIHFSSDILQKSFSHFH